MMSSYRSIRRLNRMSLVRRGATLIELQVVNSMIGLLAGQPRSWTYSPLPYIEQMPLYELGSDQGRALSRDQAIRLQTATPVAMYQCPSRRGGNPLEVRW